MKVSDVMSRDVQRCSPTDSLHRAAQLMYERDCGSIAVVGDEDGRLHGIITDRDVCIAAYRTEKHLKEIALSRVMSQGVTTCFPDTTLSEAEDMMRGSHVRRLPVVDENGVLVGMLSLADLALSAMNSGEKAAELEVFKTLAAVSLPERPRAADIIG
jgi:CBS domain-containing protein